MTAYGRTWAGLIEAFQIFQEYEPGEEWASIVPEHDEIFAGHDMYEQMTPEELARLEELGWVWDETIPSFVRGF